MDIRNCNVCGVIFNNVLGREICNECYRKEEELFQTVSKFIRSQRNRKATLEKIAEETNVSKDLLSKWIKLGRLQTTFFENLEHSCEICNKTINSGNICSDCVSELKEISQTTNIKGNVMTQTQVTYHAGKKNKK